MLSIKSVWRRHKRKVFTTVGVLGSSYVLYKLYVAHKQKLFDLEREIEVKRETDEAIKAQLQSHFENIQRIADGSTLPYAMNNLRERVLEGLDPMHLTNRLKQERGQLTSLEKLELWERLKILSFTRVVLSAWAMTTLSLYIRIQVNILGRHLYVDTARGIGSSHMVEEEADHIYRHDQQEFLAIADYLSNYGLTTLIPHMQGVATEVLNGKQLRDPFNSITLGETIMQILDIFMGIHHWVTYLVPENAVSYKQLKPTSSNNSETLPEISKLDQLMVEAREVVSSADFMNLMEVSLRSVVDALVEDMGLQSTGPGIPLAKLLPLLAQISPLLLEEPSKNRYLNIIQSLPEVKLFYTLLYSNTLLAST